MAKNYMLITVENREIMTEQFYTVEEAREVMHAEMREWGGVPQEIFDVFREEFPPEVFDAYPEEYASGDFGYSDYGGFAKGKNGEQLDWSIVAL